MPVQFEQLLKILYDPEVADALCTRIEHRLKGVSFPSVRSGKWSPTDIVFITYADAFFADDEPPLQSLGRFLNEHLAGLISQVHLLPFFPYTSDDGFSVSDYRTVDQGHGDWSDIQSLSENHELIFDLVINHASSQHDYFQDFIDDRPPGNRYFLTAQAGDDVSQVTRPRASSLLQTYDTAKGPQQVWCTFSRDQVDWDFSNPDVLFEFVDLLVTYMERGATWIRMDAIAYLWKQVGTSCIHRPQTHAVVKLFRAIAEQISPDFKILTETNVPLAENLSYFGDGDEAHIVYNFSLPPLLVHGLLTGNSEHLTHWCQSLPRPPKGCTFLNFSASHDGIGIRPAEGILSDEQIRQLTDCLSQFGGRINQRQKPDGTLSPYEANISLFDAFKGTIKGEDEWQVERFLVSQGLMMALAGVPALYYNSVLAAPNNLSGLAETGRNRTINRKKWNIDEIDGRFHDASAAPYRVLVGIREMVNTRRTLDAFHPEAPQEALWVDKRLFVLVRHGIEGHQKVLCLFNLSSEPVNVAKDLVKVAVNQSLSVRFKHQTIAIKAESFELSPYAIAWVEMGGPIQSN